MHSIWIISFLIFLASCGGNNSTGKGGNYFSGQQASTSFKSDLSAKMKITSFNGNLVSTKLIDLSIASLEDASNWRQTNQLDGSLATIKSSNIIFYATDLDKRLEIARELNSYSLAEAEIIIDNDSNEKISGLWGWLDKNGAQTQKEKLPNSLQNRIVIKINDVPTIKGFLSHHRLPALWLETTSIAPSSDLNVITKVQALTFKKSLEYESDSADFSSSFMKLKVVARNYRIESYDYAVRHTYSEERPGRHDTVFRDVTKTCHLKMNRLVVNSEKEIPLDDAIEFDGNEQVENGWLVASSDTSVRFKKSLETQATTIGFASYGSCNSGMRFNDRIPGSSVVNSAARLILKADIYERVP